MSLCVLVFVAILLGHVRSLSDAVLLANQDVPLLLSQEDLALMILIFTSFNDCYTAVRWSNIMSTIIFMINRFSHIRNGCVTFTMYDT